MLILISISSFSQKNETKFSPNGIFDVVFDDKGNKYNLSDIIVEHSKNDGVGKTNNSSLLCTSGIFELYFETGSGMEIVGNPIQDQRRAIICQAFSDMSDFINTPLNNTGNTNKVKIWVRSPTALGLPTQAAGAASSFYNIPQLNSIIPSQDNPTRGIVDNEIWKTIQSGVNSYSNTMFPFSTTQQNPDFYHGYVCFNFNSTINWNLDLNKFDSSTGYVTNSVDFYTVVIHELTHMLGFNTLIDSNGYSILTYTSNMNILGWYYSRYDKFLKSSSNVSLLSNTYSGSSNCQMYDYVFNPNVSNSVIYPQCSSGSTFQGNTGLFNCSTSIVYSGSVNIPVYTPPCYEPGSSLSHFEDACYNGNTNDQYFMMSDRASGTFAKRYLKSEERLTLCDIGYSLKATFGNNANHTYVNYNTSVCNGIGIGGVNDGLSSTGSFLYEGLSGTPITISGILNNDYTNGQPSNMRYEFVQDLFDLNAIFSQTTGANNQSFTLKSFVPGLHLLRYVPYDISTGKRGNITYIFVNVLNNCIQNDICSLVRNGDFESHNYPPTYNSQVYKACGWNNSSYHATADYFNSDSTSEFYNIPCNFKGFQLDKIPGNHAYVGMVIATGRAYVLQNVYSESIKTELVSSLKPNTTYTLTFDVSLAEKNRQRPIKFQALITDTDLQLTTGGIIPNNFITSNVVFLTNSTFSNVLSSSSNGWETISFTFTTGSNPNLKYLHLGALNNISSQIESITNIDCNNVAVSNSSEAYYYLDNVKLVEVYSTNYLNAINDDFTNSPINATNGGLTLSVFNNDYYNEILNNQSSISAVTFTLIPPIPLSGATINNLGQISIPSNTVPGNYSFNYKINTVGNCTNDTATALISVNNNLFNDDISNDSFEIYPNPTFNSVYFDNSKENFHSVTIYNVLSQKLYSQNIGISENETINLESLSSGVYFLNFYGIKNKIVKIIKK
ncbi:T9SS type A sorting domain-containing protein [Flavobacterium urocaniciphilum]|uniref:T9SS type A sorting domain-containing protein n=1 Tax=Flavobacterium urocaniciphilum TaxID=1299341 RepID=UPI0015A5B66E|nr:T9SS type A sorting domain-containing protein [Flavobacterium urocaniciphilum]